MRGMNHEPPGGGGLIEAIGFKHDIASLIHCAWWSCDVDKSSWSTDIPADYVYVFRVVKGLRWKRDVLR